MMIVPSLLSADFTDLAGSVEAISGADMVHFDVMDGHFVPNLTFGPQIARAVASLTDLPLDVHLMIDNPQEYVQSFAEAGATFITVHVEACTHLHRVIQSIREAGCRPGVALNPATDLDAVKYILTDVDMILIMTVNPGFGGQSFIPAMLDKIAAARQMIEEGSRKVLIEVDGGINDKTIGAAARAGASVFVAGSYVYKGVPAERIEILRQAAR